MSVNERWTLDSASHYHFREWDDGVSLFLEGENSIFLINPFAAYLLNKLNGDPSSFQEMLELVSIDYPEDTPETLSTLLENTLAELCQSRILIRSRT